MANKYHTTWILIADGARARIVKNDGPGLGIDALDELIFESENRKVGDIMADKPGRSYDSVGGGRHAMEYSADPVRRDEQAFANMLTQVLFKAHEKGDYSRLILVAPPQMLGDLRAAMPDALKGAIEAEINKDLTQIPNGDLAGHLADVISL